MEDLAAVQKAVADATAAAEAASHHIAQLSSAEEDGAANGAPESGARPCHTVF